ncbi:hypothetical protein [Proteiniphilum sp. X52]|uniref:hypothetical protein n=1 Tax=Proteiniphilum sp. X52 TaxID=2382159 RepID=UPI00131417DC|nr:hypothetical protein [Proteiniphilum sp. X52]
MKNYKAGTFINQGGYKNRSGSGYDPEKPKHLGGVSFGKVQAGVYAITGLD